MPEMPSKPEPTHYDHLMVARTASLEVIRAAYRTLTQKYHPDRKPDDAEATRLMQLINESYAVLCDPEKREEYDRRLAEEEAHKLALALQAGRSLVPVWDPWHGVPVLHAAQERARRLRQRSRFAAIALALSVLVIAGLGVFRHRHPQLAQSTLDPLSARAGGMIQRPSSPEGTIERPAAAPDPPGESSDSAVGSSTSQTRAERPAAPAKTTAHDRSQKQGSGGCEPYLLLLPHGRQNGRRWRRGLPPQRNSRLEAIRAGQQSRAALRRGAPEVLA
jgi:hypothetical protein